MKKIILEIFVYLILVSSAGCIFTAEKIHIDDQHQPKKEVIKGNETIS